MGQMTTRELLDKVYQEYEPYSPSVVRTIQTMIDKPFLFEYENEIDTDFVDMSQDQLFGLINVILHHKQGMDTDGYLRMNSYDNIRNALYNIFEVYISMYPMANPMRSPVFVKDNVRRVLMRGKSAFSWKNVENLLHELRLEYDAEYVDYFESIMQFFYCGVRSWEELVEIDSKNINFQSKTIALPGRTIQLSDRCFELMMRIQDLSVYRGTYKTYYYVQWHKRFFRYMMTASASERIDDKSQLEMQKYIRTMYSHVVLRDRSEQINYAVLFNLGLYDTMVAKFGEQRVKNMILTHDRDNLPLWKQIQVEYGLTHRPVGKLQDDLIGFVTI